MLKRGRVNNDFWVIGMKWLTARIYQSAFLPISLALSICAISPIAAFAGYDEGVAAVQKGDSATALHEWKPLAEQGDARAQFQLGWMYENGTGVTQDYAETIRLYRLSTDQGNPYAQHNLGVMYRDGKGIPQDYKEAAALLRLAAGQGYFRAQHSLGWMYENGKGVPQDYPEAVKLYRLAAAQGFALAQHSLGWMYAGGKGVPQDYLEAVKLYRLSAAQGYAIAQNNLGWMYANGQGVVASRVVAYALYNLSIKSDPSANNRAVVNRKIVAEKMSNREIEVAQDLAHDLSKPKNMLAALDGYNSMPTIHESVRSDPPIQGSRPDIKKADTESPQAGSEWPGRPTSEPEWFVGRFTATLSKASENLIMSVKCNAARDCQFNSDVEHNHVSRDLRITKGASQLDVRFLNVKLEETRAFVSADPNRYSDPFEGNFLNNLRPILGPDGMFTECLDLTENRDGFFMMCRYQDKLTQRSILLVTDISETRSKVPFAGRFAIPLDRQK